MMGGSSAAESSPLRISCAVHSPRMTGENYEYSLNKAVTFGLVQCVPHGCVSTGNSMDCCGIWD